MPKQGDSLNLGTKRNVNTKPRKPKSDLLPPENPNPTDPVLGNLESLVDVQFVPMFSQILERGRGNITAFAMDFLGVSLEKDGQRHDGMERWWHDHFWTPERMLSSGNRWGKTFATSVKLLHNAFYQVRDPQYASLTNEYIALNLSLTIDMARISFDYAMTHALDSHLFRKFVVENEIKTAPFPMLPIGTPKSDRTNPFRSEIWARSSSKDARFILGRRFDYINYDECARDPHGKKVLDEVLRMRLADRNGRLDMTSTAAGRNWFWKEYLRGDQDRKNGNARAFSMSGSTYDNPFVDHTRVKFNEEHMAKVWADQNIFGGFADYANVFDRRQVEEMYDGVLYKICNDHHMLDSYPVTESGQYIMAIDWAVKRDDTVILVADISQSPAPIVFAQSLGLKDNGTRYAWEEQKDIAVKVHRWFKNAPCLFDSTGMVGDIIYSNLSELGMVDHAGYDFAGNMGQAKDHLIFVAQSALQNHAFQVYYNPVTQNLIDQLLLYDRDDKQLPTDWTFAFAILAERLRRANLPISEILSLPLLFATGTRKLGTLHPFDRDTYSISSAASRPRVNLLKDTGLIIVSSGNYRKEEIVA